MHVKQVLLSLAAVAACASANQPQARYKAHYFSVSNFDFQYIPHGENYYYLTVADFTAHGTGLKPVNCTYASGATFENLATFPPKAICAKNKNVLIGLQNDDQGRFVLSVAFDGQKGYKLFPLSANKYHYDSQPDGFMWEYIDYSTAFDVPYN